MVVEKSQFHMNVVSYYICIRVFRTKSYSSLAERLDDIHNYDAENQKLSDKIARIKDELKLG